MTRKTVEELFNEQFKDVPKTSNNTCSDFKVEGTATGRAYRQYPAFREFPKIPDISMIPKNG